jgi:cytochrome c-type biogenesis protein CcmH
MTIQLTLFAVLGAIAMLGAFWPLLRQPRPTADRAKAEQAVYRAQLAQLEADLARGVLDKAEAEPARIEIARRLLATEGLASTPVKSRPNRALAAVLAILVISDAGWVYMRIGAPGLPDMPAASRPPPAPEEDEGAAMQAAIAALRDAVAKDPSNAARWTILARALGANGQWPDAAEAYRRVTTLAPTNPEGFLGLATALTVANNGIVPEPARAAFRQTLALAPKNGIARFYLALADTQAGDTDAATKQWLALAADLPEESPVRGEIARRLESAHLQLPPPAPPEAPQLAAPGPDAATVANAGQMTPEARQAMIQSMIARLADRLKTTPDDAEGWLRLSRAYRVTNQPEKSADAFAHAASLRPNDPEILLQQAHLLVDGVGPDRKLPPEALNLFRRLEAIDPAQTDALWYLGLAAAQDDDKTTARGYWQRLLPLLPPDTPERRMVSEALAAIGSKK